MDKPIVSICCITYNHSLYIKDAIEGFLKQRTSFNFEIIIHDDASTDETKAIIEKYVSKYPNKINFFYQTENQYSKGVRGIAAKFTFPQARGKYIALCEGDDYWTDPHKLQKQVDFLEKNKEYSSCAHASFCIYMSKNGNQTENEITDQFKQNNKIDFDSDVSIYELFSSYPFQTATFLMRRHEFEKKKNWLNILKQGDINLFIIMGSIGKIRKFKKPMSVYRIHVDGISSNWENTNNQGESKPAVKTLKFGVSQIKGLIKLRSLYISDLENINRGINMRITQYIDQCVTEKNGKNFFKFLIYYLKVTNIYNIRIYWLLGSIKNILMNLSLKK